MEKGGRLVFNLRGEEKKGNVFLTQTRKEEKQKAEAREEKKRSTTSKGRRR